MLSAPLNPSLAPPTVAVDVRLYDRPVEYGLTLALRLDHVRVWCDERELSIAGEHVAADPRELDTLAKAAAACRAEATPLVVWNLAIAVGGHVDVLRLLEQLGGVPLIHAQALLRLGLSEGQVSAQPTTWPIRRWAPRPARPRSAQ